MENDLNAIALGFSRKYTKENPDIETDNLNIVFIHFDEDCTSAGIIADGHIVRGKFNFAGELGFMHIGNNKALDDVLKNASSDEYAELVARTVSMIFCITNPEYIVLGGSNFRSEGFNEIVEISERYIPNMMRPKIMYSCNLRQDYMDGMVFLTSELIFKGIQLT